MTSKPRQLARFFMRFNRSTEFQRVLRFSMEHLSQVAGPRSFDFGQHLSWIEF